MSLLSSGVLGGLRAATVGSGSGSDGGSDFVSDADLLRLKYKRASALVSSIFNKYHNGSARAVDPFVIRALQTDEVRLLSIQCFVEQGPTDFQRQSKRQSAAPASAARTVPLSGLSGLFQVCGGYSGPGAVMRQWDQLTVTGGCDGAMQEYVAIVDRALPGWDHPTDYPVSNQEKFWKDDTVAQQCQYCGSLFSMAQRRHHCRMCFDIFCYSCCSQSIELALCPGAPLRQQRVCCQCYQLVERDRSLLEIRRLIRLNHEIEDDICELQERTRLELAAKRREEDRLRTEAHACGCDMDALEVAIASQTGGAAPLVEAMALDTPPAHKYAPRESVEANEQLVVAHRQLQMAHKAAQCRSKKALAQMDIVLAVLHGAICFGSLNWDIVLRRMRVFLTLRELRALAQTSRGLRTRVERYKCEKKSILAYDPVKTAQIRRAELWQAECLKDDKTRAYVMDLAEEVRTRLDSTSSSDSEPDTHRDSSIGAESSSRRWLGLLTPASSSPRSSSWLKVYELLLARCDGNEMEFDSQIQCDVQRTFGASALRRARSRKAYEVTNAAPSPIPVDKRKRALTNVLRAFACVNTEIGYCQGMDHVAALVLSVVEWQEARAFWLLTSLVASRQYELDLLFGPGLPRLNLRCFQLERLVRQHLPELSQHLEELEFPTSMFSTGWFMTLFSNMEALSYDGVVRALDGFLVAGWKHLFRVALVILENLQYHLLASSFEQIPQIFYDIHDYAPKLADVDYVVVRAAMFKVTNSMLKRLQHEYEQLETPGRDSDVVENQRERVSSKPKSTSEVAANGVGSKPLKQVETATSPPTSQSSQDNSSTNEDAKNAATTSGGQETGQSKGSKGTKKNSRRRSRNRSGASKAANENAKSPAATRTASPPSV